MYGGPCPDNNDFIPIEYIFYFFNNFAGIFVNSTIITQQLYCFVTIIHNILFQYINTNIIINQSSFE